MSFPCGITPIRKVDCPWYKCNSIIIVQDIIYIISGINDASLFICINSVRSCKCVTVNICTVAVKNSAAIVVITSAQMCRNKICNCRTKTVTGHKNYRVLDVIIWDIAHTYHTTITIALSAVRSVTRTMKQRI